MRPTFDERDASIVREREALFNEYEGPRVGDYIEFSCGKLRRISYIWPLGDAQTTDHGSFHLSESGRLSMSGSHFLSVPSSSLTDTGRTMPGLVWIFHHNEIRGHYGVETNINFRVYSCNLPATS